MPPKTVNGIEMYYEISGAGPPLTLIAGMGGSARQWQWMAPALSRSFTVIAFDNRDAGRSGRSSRDYTTDLLADDTAGLLQALGTARSHIMGISFGGLIAQKIALRHPAMVDRLVLGCTMAGFLHMPPSPENLEKLQAAQAAGFEEGVDIMMQLFLTEKFMAAQPAEAERLRKTMLTEKREQGTEALYRQLGAGMSHSTLVDVQKIGAPALIMTGTADPIATPENARFFMQQISRSTLVEFPGGFHAFWVEHHGEACGAIETFCLQPA